MEKNKFDEILEILDNRIPTDAETVTEEPKNTIFDEIMGELDKTDKDALLTPQEIKGRDKPIRAFLESGYSSLAAGTVRSVAEVLDMSGFKDASQEANEVADALFKGTAELTVGREYDRIGEKNLLMQGRIGEGLELSFRHSLQSSPVSLLAMASVYGGVPGKVIGGMVMGIPATGQKLEQLENIEGMTEGMKRINALGTGLSEVASEHFGALFGTKYAKKLMGKVGVEAVKSMIKKKIIKGWASKLGVGLLTGSAGEGAEEGVNTITENIIDYLTGATDNTNIMNGVLDSIVAGSLSAMWMEAPMQTLEALSETDDREIGRIKKKLEKLEENELTKQEKTELKQEIKTVLEKRNKELAGDRELKNFADITPEEEASLQRIDFEEEAQADDIQNVETIAETGQEEQATVQAQENTETDVIGDKLTDIRDRLVNIENLQDSGDLTKASIEIDALKEMIEEDPETILEIGKTEQGRKVLDVSQAIEKKQEKLLSELTEPERQAIQKLKEKQAEEESKGAELVLEGESELKKKLVEARILWMSGEKSRAYETYKEVIREDLTTEELEEVYLQDPDLLETVLKDIGTYESEQETNTKIDNTAPAEEQRKEKNDEATTEEKFAEQENTTEKTDTNLQEPTENKETKESGIEQKEETSKTELKETSNINTPAQEREQGYKIVNGEKKERQKPVKALKGKKSKLDFSNDVAPVGRIAIIAAEDLQPSHIDGHLNDKNFIQDAQPKNRTDRVSENAREQIAQKLDPEKITANTTNAYSGMPTTNERGEVIQGNNRSDAIKTAYKRYRESAEKYKQWLIDNADRFGLDAEAITKMKAPVMVNMLEIEDADAIKLGQYTANDLETGGIRRIEAKSVIRKLDNKQREKLIKILTETEKSDASIRSILRSNIVKGLDYLLKKGAITGTQYQSAFNVKGLIKKDALTDMESLLMYDLIEGGRADLGEMFEGLPVRVQNVLIQLSPKLSRTFKEEIQESIIAYTEYKQSGTNLGNWLTQIDVFTQKTAEEIYTTYAIELIKEYDNSGSKNWVKDFSNRMGRFVTAVEGIEDDLFPEKPIPKDQAFIENILGGKYVAKHKERESADTKESGKAEVERRRTEETPNKDKSDSKGKLEAKKDKPETEKTVDKKVDEVKKQPHEMTREEFRNYYYEFPDKDIEMARNNVEKRKDKKLTSLRKEYDKTVNKNIIGSGNKALSDKVIERWDELFDEELHKIIVEQALREGKHIPPDVLKDYPEIAKKYKAKSEKELIEKIQRDVPAKDEKEGESDQQIYVDAVDKGIAKGTIKTIAFHKAIENMPVNYDMDTQEYKRQFELLQIKYEDELLEKYYPKKSEKKPTAKDTSESNSFREASPEEIPYNTAYQAHTGTSFDPEIRAKQEQQEYANNINKAYRELSKKAKTDAQKELLNNEMQKFKEGYKSRFIDYLSARSGLFSTMIAGTSNFPTERMRRKNEIVDSRYERLSEYYDKAKKNIEKKLKAQAIEEAGGELAVTEKKLEQQIKNHEQFKKVNSILRNKKLSLTGKRTKLRGLGLSDKLVTQLLDAKDALGRPILIDLASSNAAIKRYREKVDRLKKQESYTDEDTNILYESDDVKIVNNKEAERVQIFFASTPDTETRSKLKSNGWRWSPKNKAWQRKNTINGINSAKRLFDIKKTLKVEKKDDFIFGVEKAEGKQSVKEQENKAQSEKKAKQEEKQPGEEIGELNSINPTGSLYIDYTPEIRAKQKINIQELTTLDKTIGGNSDDIITIYRGAPKYQKEIVAGDFITDNYSIAKSYIGDDGHIISKEVRKGDVLDDAIDGGAGEYIYRPNADKEIKLAGKPDFLKTEFAINHIKFLKDNPNRFNSFDDFYKMFKITGRPESQFRKIWEEANKDGISDKPTKKSESTEKAEFEGNTFEQFTDFLNKEYQKTPFEQLKKEFDIVGEKETKIFKDYYDNGKVGEYYKEIDEGQMRAVFEGVIDLQKKPEKKEPKNKQTAPKEAEMPPALKSLMEITDIDDLHEALINLAGKGNKEVRRSIVSYIKGKKVPLSESTLSKLQEIVIDYINKPTKKTKQEDKPAKETESTEKVEDFGEVLKGAKKYTWARHFLNYDINDVDAKKDLTINKIFPEPDYAKIAEEQSKTLAALLYYSRESIKMILKQKQRYKINYTKSKIEPILEMVKNILSEDVSESQIINLLESGNNSFIAGKLKVIMLVDFNNIPADIMKYSVDTIQYKIMVDKDGEEVFKQSSFETKTEDGKFFSFYKKDKKTGEKILLPEMNIRDLKEAKKNVIAVVKGTSIIKEGFKTTEEAYKWLEEHLNKPKKKKRGKVKFVITMDSKEYHIKKETASGKYLKVMSGFKTHEEARNYLLENQLSLEKKLKELKKVPKERRDKNRDRIGIDHTGGKQVTPEMFTEAFGFRGVQFGNWVENKRRQEDLAKAYNGLTDLAIVLGVPTKALSLNGELGLAFGARGSGNAMAHYDPDYVVINLTKTRGAGSLAHEWWHALDNYFGNILGSDDYITKSPRPIPKVQDGEVVATYGGARKETVEAFAEVVRTIRDDTMLIERSIGLDIRRTKDYWSTIIEMGARSFEKYIIEKLKQKGFSNDYLANIVEYEDYEEKEYYPYPLDSEMKDIERAYDKLFKTLKTKETEKGTALYRRVFHGTPHKFDKFSMTKVGTGEGAQAFGYGLYFTEGRGIAEFYAENVFDDEYYDRVNKRLRDLAGIMDKYQTSYGKFNNPLGYEAKQEYDRLVEERDSKKKTIISAEIWKNGNEDLLDWDGDVTSKQREKILDAFHQREEILGDFYKEMHLDKDEIKTQQDKRAEQEKALKNSFKLGGMATYRKLSEILGSDKLASGFLNRAGIDGIVYKAEGGKSKHKNYVVFDENAIEIVEQEQLREAQEQDSEITEQEIQEVKELIKDIAGEDVTVEVVSKIITPEGREALGSYKDSLIKIAKGKANPKNTAIHEAIHYIEDMSLTDEEMSKLEKVEPDEEKRAEKIIQYINRGKGFVGTVKRIIDKMARFIRKLVNKQKDLDVLYNFYDKVLAGEYAKVGKRKSKIVKKDVKFRTEKLLHSILAEKLEEVRRIGVKITKIEETRKALDLEDIELSEVEKWQDVYDKVKSAGLKDEAVDIARNALRVNRNLTRKEIVAIALREPEIRAEIDKMATEAIKLNREGKDSSYYTGRIEALRNEMDTLTTALRKTSREVGRTLKLFGVILKREDGEYVLDKVLHNAELRKGSKLTVGEQKELIELTAKLKEVGELADRLQKELDEATLELMKERAEKAINEKKTKERKKSVIQRRRKNLYNKLAELGYRMNDIIGVSFKAAKLIKELADTYVEEGLRELETITDRIQGKMPDLTRLDIYRSIGGDIQNTEVRIVSKKQQTIRELRKQAKIKAKIERLETRIFQNPSRKVRDSEDYQKLKDQLLELEQSVIDIPEQEAIYIELNMKILEVLADLENDKRVRTNKGGKKQELRVIEARKRLREVLRLADTLQTIRDLKKQIETGEYKETVKAKATVKSKELEKALTLKKKYQREIREAIFHLKRTSKRDFFTDLFLQMPRTLMTSGELSVVLRQGAKFFTSNPIISANTLKTTIPTIKSYEEADKIKIFIENHPDSYLFEQAELFLSSYDHIKVGNQEEGYYSNIAARLMNPIGGLVRAAERFAVSYLNLLRVNMFEVYKNAHPEAPIEDLREWARFVNITTGRGKMDNAAKDKVLGQMSKFLFSARFSYSQFQYSSALIHSRNHKEVQKEILKQQIKYFSVISTALLMALAMGADVEDDPASADFLKIKIGNIRIDISGGYISSVRLFYYSILSVLGNYGRIDYDERRSIRDSFNMFINYKTAPTINMFFDLLDRKNVVGEDVTPLNFVTNYATPMAYTEIIQALNEDPLTGIILTPLIILGISTQTYEKKKKKNEKNSLMEF